MKAPKPIRKVGKVGHQWIKFRSQWHKANPEPHTCGICLKPIASGETTLDHIIPRSSRPDLRFDPSNIQPAHYMCNSIKGSNHKHLEQP